MHPYSYLSRNAANYSTTTTNATDGTSTTIVTQLDRYRWYVIMFKGLVPGRERHIDQESNTTVNA